MSILSKFAPVARTALYYVTAGTLTVVWSGVWLLYLRNNQPSGAGTYYWAFGFLLTGLTVMLIGLGVGWIDRSRRSTRQAESPQRKVSPAAIEAEPTMVEVNPSAAPNGQNNSSRMPMYQSAHTEQHTPIGKGK